MTKNNNNIMRAFTLVELAIVLVIIGLLVGGVVAGQSIIESAKRSTIITEIKSFDSSLRLFKDEYDYLPGDLPIATSYWPAASDCMNGTNKTQTCNGDGDKTIDYEWGGISNAPWETRRAVQHLALAGYLKESLTGATSNNCVAGANCYVLGENTPGSKSKESRGYIIFTATSDNSILSYEAGKTLVFLADLKTCTQESWTGRWHCPATKPKDQKYIDEKIDDGRPLLGSISDIRNTSYNFSPNCTSSEDPASATYNISNNTEACLMYYSSKY